jgi:hypothetical protein
MSKFIKNPSLHTTDEFKIQSSAANKPILLIESTSADNKCAELTFFKNANATTGGVGRIAFDGLNDNGDVVEYGRISCNSSDITDNDERAIMYFYVLPDEGFSEFNNAQLALKLEGTSTADFTKATIYDTLHLGSSAAGATLQIGERADHLTTEAGMGQLWVKSNTPADLYYTDDAGQDVRITNDGELAVSGGSDFKKQYISQLHRWGTDSSPSTSEFYGGYRTNYYRNAIFYGLNASDDTDTSATAWTVISYSDFLAHAPCTVTGMSAVARQDFANADVELCLFKATIADNVSHTSNQAVDFVCKVAFAANADTTSVHAVHSTASIDGTGADLDAGDMLFLAFRYTSSGSSDAKYWYIRHTIEITYD